MKNVILAITFTALLGSSALNICFFSGKLMFAANESYIPQVDYIEAAQITAKRKR